jgi:hypothetical protein
MSNGLQKLWLRLPLANSSRVLIGQTVLLVLRDSNETKYPAVAISAEYR